MPLLENSLKITPAKRLLRIVKLYTESLQKKQSCREQLASCLVKLCQKLASQNPLINKLPKSGQVYKANNLTMAFKSVK